MINNEQYIEFEDWQILGRFYGATVGTEWTHRLVRDEKTWGYESRAVVYPEFEEPRHTSASSRRKNKENQEELRLFCHQT